MKRLLQRELVSTRIGTAIGWWGPLRLYQNKSKKLQMGDRANIVVREDWGDSLDDREGVFLYTHWSGYELPEALRQGLIRGRGRWTDDSYLARILFCEMVKDDINGDTGYGISTRLTDNEYDLLVVLPSKQTIVRLPEGDYDRNGFSDMEECLSISFTNYITTERTWDNLTD